jgi:tetratricopeptide (TPR) repeat protein
MSLISVNKLSFPQKLAIFVSIGLLVNLAAISYVCFHLVTKGQLPKEVAKAIPDEFKKIVPDEKTIWGEAEKIADQSIHREPNSAVAYGQRAVARWNLNEREGAYKDLDRAIQLNPDNATFYDYRGDYKYQEKKTLSDFNIAMTLQPREFRHLMNRAKVYGVSGKLDLSLADFDKAIANNQYVQYAHVEKGVFLQAAHRYAQALSEYEKGLALGDSDSKEKALVGFFQTAILCDEFERAISGLEKYGQEHPKKSYAFLRIADIQKALGQTEKREKTLLLAIQALSSEISDAPPNAELLKQRAELFKQLEGYEHEFETDCDEAIRLYKDDADQELSKYWKNVANIYELAGNVGMMRHICKLEIARLDALIAKNEKDGEAYHSRADVYKVLKDYSSAIRDYKIGEKYMCDCDSYFFHLGRMYLEQHAFEKAAENFESEIKRGKPDYVDFVGLSAALEGLEEHEEALANANKAIAMKNLGSRAYYWAGKALQGKGLVAAGDLSIKKAVALGYEISKD